MTSHCSDIYPKLVHDALEMVTPTFDISNLVTGIEYQNQVHSITVYGELTGPACVSSRIHPEWDLGPSNCWRFGAECSCDRRGTFEGKPIFSDSGTDLSNTTTVLSTQ
jgi:hypothetical protein